MSNSFIATRPLSQTKRNVKERIRRLTDDNVADRHAANSKKSKARKAAIKIQSKLTLMNAVNMRNAASIKELEELILMGLTDQQIMEKFDGLPNMLSRIHGARAAIERRKNL